MATVVVEAGQTKVMIAGGHDGETVHLERRVADPNGRPAGFSERGDGDDRARYGYNAVVLSDETILVMGGADRIYVPEEGPEAARQDAERWVGLLGQWLPLANRMSSRRYHAFAGRLGEDGAFVLGGSSCRGPTDGAHKRRADLLSNGASARNGCSTAARQGGERSGHDLLWRGSTCTPGVSATECGA